MMRVKYLLGLLVALMLIAATMLGATSAFAEQHTEEQQQESQVQEYTLYSIHLVNEREKADFTINKVDENGNPLKGAKFEVYGKGEVVPYIEEQEQHHEEPVQE